MWRHVRRRQQYPENIRNAVVVFAGRDNLLANLLFVGVAEVVSCASLIMRRRWFESTHRHNLHKKFLVVWVNGSVVRVHSSSQKMKTEEVAQMVEQLKVYFSQIFKYPRSSIGSERQS